jgi:hypothetical protein
MVDLFQVQQLVDLLSGILGFVLLVMMVALTTRLRSGLLYRALVPWTTALVLIGITNILQVFFIIAPLILQIEALLRVVLFLWGGIILWNSIRNV